MNSIVALEISSDAIRAAEISGPNSKNPKLKKIAEIELPPETTGESCVYESEAFVTILKEFWLTEKFSTKNVVLVVGGRRFIIRSHETTHTSLKALRNLIKFEASDVITDQTPNPIIDFYPTSQIDTKAGVKTTGLVISTPAEPIEELVNAITLAGLSIEYVDFAPMAIARYIRNNHASEDDYALVNIRENSTDILIGKNNIPQMIRVAPKGLDTKRGRRGKHMVEETSITSFNGGGFQESPIRTLVREISMTLSLQVDDYGAELKKLYIAGPRSTDPDLVELLQDELNIDVIALTTEGLVETLSEDDSESSSAEFVAMCAGMRGKK